MSSFVSRTAPRKFVKSSIQALGRKHKKHHHHDDDCEDYYYDWNCAKEEETCKTECKCKSVEKTYTGLLKAGTTQATATDISTANFTVEATKLDKIVVLEISLSRTLIAKSGSVGDFNAGAPPVGPTPAVFGDNFYTTNKPIASSFRPSSDKTVVIRFLNPDLNSFIGVGLAIIHSTGIIEIQNGAYNAWSVKVNIFPFQLVYTV